MERELGDVVGKGSVPWRLARVFIGLGGLAALVVAFNETDRAAQIWAGIAYAALVAIVWAVDIRLDGVIKAINAPRAAVTAPVAASVAVAPPESPVQSRVERLEAHASVLQMLLDDIEYPGWQDDLDARGNPTGNQRAWFERKEAAESSLELTLFGMRDLLPPDAAALLDNPRRTKAPTEECKIGTAYEVWKRRRGLLEAVEVIRKRTGLPPSDLK